ncbi:MAG: archease [Candidatus Eisenbacteria bacterium]
MERRSGGAAFGYESFDHTADIGLRVYGRTRGELFEQAALGLASLLLESGEVRPVEERVVSLEHQGFEEGLIGWLNEILYLREIGRFLPATVAVLVLDSRRLRARLSGETLDPSRHLPGLEIKAATYHDLRIDEARAPDGTPRFETRVILDI